MASRPQDLTVAKSDIAAETLASAIWDAANQHSDGTAVGASVQRSLRRHARELLELHDIKADEVLSAPRTNNVGVEPTYANGQG